MSLSRRVMSFVSRGLLVGAAALLAPSLGGCVSQQQFDKLSAANKALEERNVMLQQELESKDAANNLLKQRIAEGDSAVSAMSQRNSELSSEMLALKNNYGDLNTRLNSVSQGVLDPAVDRQLRELASAHSDLIRYDPARGMVQFASDLTFNSGSVDVSSGAKSSLEQFARILASASGGNYDVRIVGHTDNVAVSRPETRRLHPTNMYLSAHRAIAVRDVLQSMGVAPERMEIAGWGPYRPVVPNPPSGGAAQNRRVEIYLVPSTHNGPVTETDGSTASQQPKPTVKVPTEQPMK